MSGARQAMPVADTVTLTVPSPIKVDFQILDADTSAPIPGRLIVVGNHPAFPDTRLFETADRQSGIVDAGALDPRHDRGHRRRRRSGAVSAGGRHVSHLCIARHRVVGRLRAGEWHRGCEPRLSL